MKRKREWNEIQKRIELSITLHSVQSYSPIILNRITDKSSSLIFIFIFFIIFENRLILKHGICYSNLRLNSIQQNSQQPTSVGVTIMTSRQSYGLINPNRIAYVHLYI